MNPFLISEVSAPPIVEFAQRAQTITPSTRDRFDMTQAVPAFPPFPAIRRGLAADLNDPDTSFYTDVQGLAELRTLTAETHVLAPGLAAEQVMITAGANHAMFTALQLYFRAGDAVALLEPYYFNHQMALQMMGLTHRHLALDVEDGFVLSASRVIEGLKRHPVQGLVLVSPNNPTGARYDAREILALLSWTSANGIELLLDETYMRFDRGHLDEPSLAGFIGKGLTLIGSFSKSHSLTGFRVGYLISGPRQMDQALKIQDTSIICAPHLGQRAAIHGLRHCGDDVQRQAATMIDNTALVSDRCRQLRNFRLTSAGTYFGYLQHPFGDRSCTDATLLLYENTGILGLPATMFGKRQQAFIRLAFCNVSRERLEVALTRLAAFDGTALAGVV